MSYLILGLVAVMTAFLTLFSGFGLGTLLMPAFAVFFPLPVAIASTAVVHGANNLLKVSLMYRSVNRQVLLRFGLPAIFAAMFGAALLNELSTEVQILEWSLGPWLFATDGLRLLMGFLILGFATFDLLPIKKSWQFSTRWLALGGVLSGFFGGLSGHQGAFRSMFLLRCQLTAKEFVATQAIIAAMVDFTRLSFYGLLLAGFWNKQSEVVSLDWSLVLFATLCAFVGTYLGKQWLEKTDIKVIRWTAAVLLYVVALGLITGWI